MIYGEKGAIQMHERFHETKQVSIFDEQGELIETRQFPRESFGYNYEIEAVCENIRKGENENPWMRLEDSIALMKILDEVRRVAI
jgi:predicted dehydrogenase